jgi:hypothetical protein
MIIDGIDVTPSLNAEKLATISQRGFSRADSSFGALCSGPIVVWLRRRGLLFDNYIAVITF